MASTHDPDSDADDQRTSGTELVIVVLGVVVAISALWFYSAIWSADKANPETIKQAAKHAEKQCVLMGGSYDQCKSLVGEHHSTCRDDNLTSTETGEELNRERYIDCMERAFRQAGVGS